LKRPEGGVGVFVVEKKGDLGARHRGAPEVVPSELLAGSIEHFLKALILGG